MFRTSLAGLDRKRLRLWLALFFLALAIPTAVLVRQTYSQLKWEAFHQHRVLAEELAARIDEQLIHMIRTEETRPFADYGFLIVAGDPAAGFVQRSPLSAYPVGSAIPGLIGYFQVDAQGAFSTPLLPPPGTGTASYGISGQERKVRLALQERIQHILGRNRLVSGGRPDATAGKASKPHPRRAPPRAAGEAVSATGRSASPPSEGAALVPAQAGFDRLKAPPIPQGLEQKQTRQLGRVEEPRRDPRYQAESGAETQDRIRSQTTPSRAARKERSALALPHGPARGEEREGRAVESPSVRIRTFDSEIDPFEFSLLESGQFVLFRKVWHDGQRYIQGGLIERQPFLRDVIESGFRKTALSHMSELIVAYQGDVLSAFPGETSGVAPPGIRAPDGALLYRMRLSAPLSDLALLFGITDLPAGPGTAVLGWVAAILVLVLCGGFFLMYRLGVRQIELARQQQDFVSAVSHELKTPLTSIRMYGEMLREGWAPPEKQRTYYDYIFHESERLSRLITNVLQLARMTRNDLQIEPRPVTVSELMDTVGSKISSLIERSGFELDLDCSGGPAQAVIRVDADGFAQIIINLVDNAIKFSARAQAKAIHIACRLQRDGTVMFSVRDYGPGVPRDQMKRIFRLFYRSENELTRETGGTGIGLALVHQLAQAMNGRVDVVNREPGAEFQVSFTVLESRPPNRGVEVTP